MVILLIYSKFDDETDEQFLLRVCENKESIGTWKDVADVLNKEFENNYDESAYRKKYQSFQKVLNANRNKYVDSDSQLEDINNKLNELRKEKFKIQTLNLERNRLDRNEARQELYYELIADAITTLPLPDFKEIKANRKHKLEYLVGISDIHYGACFVSENNKYSPEICRKRFEKLLGELVSFIDSNNLSCINITTLGDDIQGILRINDLKLNDSTVVKSVVQYCRLMAQFLNELSKYVYIDFYPVNFANHTQIRVLNAKASELADEDLEYIINHYISDLLMNNDRVKVHIDDSNKQYIMFNINGNTIAAMHGHTVKDINNILKDKIISAKKDINYIFLGHYHGGKSFVSHENYDSDSEVIIVPGFIGSDPYSDTLMKGCKSSVTIYGFDVINGMTETKKIILN